MKRPDKGKHHKVTGAEYLLVDGYNIINSWPSLQLEARDNLENSREKLIHILADYQGYRGIKIILVFDAHMTDTSLTHHEWYNGVEVVYTRQHETADHYIERWVDNHGKGGNVWVATSDYLEQTIIMGRGGMRLSARELQEEIERIRDERTRDYLKRHKREPSSLGDRVNPDILGKLEAMRRQS